MSLFSKKQEVPQDTFLESEAIIKTMQDDINALNNLAHPQTSVPSHTDSKKISSEESPEKKPNATQSPFMKADSQKEPVEKSVSNTPAPAPTQSTKTSSSALTFVFIAVIILMLVGGGYYFVTTRSIPAAPDNTEVSLEQNVSPAITQETAPIFSKDTPNYLPIDTTQATPESIKELLRKTAQDSAALGSIKPVEFVLTDESNNPLSFASFATMSGITLSSPVVSTLGGKFSLFMFTDQGSTHAGISVETTNKQASLDALIQKETSLAQDLSPLFLGDSVTKTGNSFGVTTYKNISVRFLNLHPETLLSIDYSVTDKHLVIGMSMRTHRAIIDVIGQ